MSQPASEWGVSPAMPPTLLPSQTMAPVSDTPPRRRSKRSSNGNFNGWEPPPKLKKILKSWQFWVVVTGISFGGAGLFATALLLRLPALPNCPAIFWPTASASLRIYCAQLAANKDTIDDLLYAIDLVNELPADHPLREEINRNIEQWSEELLDLCEETFQAGKLEEAISMARKIPGNISVYGLVNERIDKWQSIWLEAEEIYKAAEAEMRKQNWPLAFRQAVRLLDVGNNYWATTKYEELTELLKSAKEDGAKLAKAVTLAEEGGLKNLVEAIKLAKGISSKSHVYKDAQEAIRKFARQMMDLAQEKLNQRDLQEAISIARQIPDVGLKDEIQDFIDLARAESMTWANTAAGYEAAIAAAQKITPKRPLYSKARMLVNRWQYSIEDIGNLEKARSLAQGGRVTDLREAISQAQLISSNKPLWDQAQTDINRWQAQIETQEDQPILDRADMLALSGNPNDLRSAINEANKVGSGRALYDKAQAKISEWNRQIQVYEDRPALERANMLASSGSPEALQAAINEANRINNGRALYGEAQDRISSWQDQLQRQEDQPILDRARELANEGRLSDAIAQAERIKPGRALYSEAQDVMRGWQDEVRSKQNLEDAYRYARSGTAETLASAIRAANQVSDSSLLRSEADVVISQWSQQILEMARERAGYDLQGAIDMAGLIPSYSNLASTAQTQVEAWQQLLNPAPVPSAAPAAPPPPAP